MEPRTKEDALHRLRATVDKLSDDVEKILESDDKLKPHTIDTLVDMHGVALSNLREVRFYVEKT